MQLHTSSLRAGHKLFENNSSFHAMRLENIGMDTGYKASSSQVELSSGLSLLDLMHQVGHCRKHGVGRKMETMKLYPSNTRVK